MRILGLDVGTKTVGVSVSDPMCIIATGVTTIDRVGIRKDTGKVLDYIREYDCRLVVMGLPLNLDDSDSIQTERVREFRQMLENKLKSNGPLSKVRVVWQDERYSTTDAEEVLIAANMSREDRKKIIDRQAAIVILQRYLDRLQYQKDLLNSRREENEPEITIEYIADNFLNDLKE